MKAKYPAADAQTIGAHFIGEYSWYVASIAVGAYLAEQRVPDLSPENMALRYTMFQWTDHGESGESKRFDVRFLSHRFAALPDDQAARYADRMVVLNRGEIVANGTPHTVLVPELIADIFGVHVNIVADPISNAPVCLLYAVASRHDAKSPNHATTRDEMLLPEQEQLPVFA